MKPIVKWVGGKTKLLPELKQRMPAKYGRYFEPFAGGAALFFDLLPSLATIADFNADLIATYETVAHEPEEIILWLMAHKAAHTADDHYNDVRTRWNRGEFETPSARAAAFIYLNKTCFNGLYRVNLDGKFNVPKGKYKKPPICDEAGLRAASEALSHVALHAGDFRVTTGYAVRNDFVYFDPPYVPVSKTSNFTSYTGEGFGINEQCALADHARALVRRGVKVMLSNSDTRIVRELYQDDFHIDTVQCGRAINSKGAGRGKVREVIITSYTNAS